MDIYNARYISLGTYRKSGAVVNTPVWAAFADGALFVFSAGEAGKVKRLRHSSRAQVAVCDARGKLLGEWHAARAELITDDRQVQLALQVMREKYGWQMWLADVGARLTGRFERRAYIRVALTEQDAQH